jgi:hypothetical protein
MHPIAALLLVIAPVASADSVYELEIVNGHPSCVHRDIAVASSEVSVPLHVINAHANAGLTIELRGTAQLEKYPAAKAAFERI